MASVRCPECGQKERIPADWERPTIRCSECGIKIPLEDNDEEEKRRPAKQRQPSDSIGISERPPLRARRDEDEDDMPSRRRNRDDDDDEASAPSVKRKKKRGSKTWKKAFAALDLHLKIALITAAVALPLACIPFIGSAAVLICVALVLYGYFLFLWAAYNESLLEALTCLPVFPLCWVVWLRLMITRWDRVKTGVFVFSVGVIALTISFAFLVGNVTIVRALFSRPEEFAQGNPPPVFQPINQGFPDNPPAVKNPVPKPDPPPPQPPPPAKLTGDAALDVLLRDFDDPNSIKSRQAAEALARVAPDPKNRAVVVQKLSGRLRDQNPFLRKAALDAFATWASPDDVPILIDLLSDTDSGTRNQALVVVGRFRDERTVKPVVNCLKDVFTRREAGKALREMGPMAEKEVLVFLVNEKDITVMRDAVNILKDIGTPRSIPTLQQATTNAILRRPAQEAMFAITARSKK